MKIFLFSAIFLGIASALPEALGTRLGARTSLAHMVERQSCQPWTICVSQISIYIRTLKYPVPPASVLAVDNAALLLSHPVVRWTVVLAKVRLHVVVPDPITLDGRFLRDDANVAKAKHAEEFSILCRDRHFPLPTDMNHMIINFKDTKQR
ncbi:hypothetical protein OPT61_g7618 [Boeremia exigua]|uniref:Uncharacterized protein n=1 Tax=Boeremia exigua TaxID=749465 RepID=A0ACC2I1T6_9PLEO|nr:hypothetical protein OPT61_g7618 [Boeremia exigua]